MTHEHLLSRTVRDARIGRGESIDEFAAVAKVTPSTLRRIESGEYLRGPQMRTLRALGVVLGKTPAELLGEVA